MTCAFPGSDLVLSLRGTTDSVTLRQFYAASALTGPILGTRMTGAQIVRFADGSQWTLDDLKAIVFAGTAGNDSIRGTIGSDTLSGWTWRIHADRLRRQRHLHRRQPARPGHRASRRGHRHRRRQRQRLDPRRQHREPHAVGLGADGHWQCAGQPPSPATIWPTRSTASTATARSTGWPATTGSTAATAATRSTAAQATTRSSAA